MPRPSESDLSLLKRLQSGDRTAVADLYDRHFDHLYSLVVNLVDGEQRTAEEIVQETLLTAIRSAKRFHGQSSIYIWLCSIAYQKLVEHHRPREHKHTVSGPDVHATDAAVDTRWAVNLALEKLPPDYRQVLVLKYVEGMSIQEVAEIIHRSPKATDDLLTRARQALQSHLAEVQEG